MSFEEDMIESGFSDEESYLESLLDKHDEEQIWADVSYSLDKSEKISNSEFQDYLNIIRGNKIFNEVKNILDNRFLHSKLRFYKVQNYFLDKYPIVKYFYKILSDDGLKYGYCDNIGNIVIPCIYDEINLIQQGIAIVCNNNNYFCINIDNEQITPILEGPANWINPKYGLIHHNVKGAAVIELTNSLDHKTFTLINIKGLMVKVDYEKWIQLPAKYTFVDNTDFMPLIPVRYNGKYGFINRKLSEIIPCEYEAYEYNYDNDYVKLVTGKSQHCFTVMKGGIMTIFDENGVLLLKLN